MRTPAGVECKFFYGDYRRGKKSEECRLIDEGRAPYKWTADLCKSCPVPGILQANSCPHLILHAYVDARFLGLWRRVRANAYCTLSQQNVAEPHIGCGQCHPLPPVFTKLENDPDTAP